MDVIFYMLRAFIHISLDHFCKSAAKSCEEIIPNAEDNILFERVKPLKSPIVSGFVLD